MTTTLAPVSTRPPRVSVAGARQLALGGALMTFGFAALHAYWALGGRWGVPPGTGAISARSAFLAYDIATAVALVVAGVIGLVLSMPVGGGRHRLLLVRLAAVGAVLALLRGAPGLLQDATNALTGREVTPVGVLADVWFVVAGAVFLVVARRLRATARVVSGRRG